MKTINRYTLDENIAREVRMVARFEQHREQDPDCKISSIVYKEEVQRRIADRVFRIIVDQEKKKLIK